MVEWYVRNMNDIGYSIHERERERESVEFNVLSASFFLKLNDVQMTAMTWSNSIRPNERAQKINGLHSILDFGHNEYMKAFGMEVAKEMTVVPARILPAPQVLYKGDVSVIPQFGSWQVLRNNISTTKAIRDDA